MTHTTRKPRSSKTERRHEQKRIRQRKQEQLDLTERYESQPLPTPDDGARYVP